MGFNVSGTITLDGKGWESELNKLQKDTEKFSKTAASSLETVFAGGLGGGLLAKGLSALGLGAVAGLGKRMSDEVMGEFKEVKVGSQLLNLDPDTFQRLKKTADATDTSVEAMAKSMEHVALGLEKIKEGGKEGEKMVEMMGRLGVTLNDIETGDYQQIWFKIAAAMKTAEVTGERLAALHEVEGRGGHMLIPAFRKGFEDRGGIFDDEQLAKLQELKAVTLQTDAVWKDIGHTAGGFFATIWQAAKALPAIPVAMMGNPAPRNLGDRIHQGFQQAVVDQKDAARAEAQGEADAARYRAEQDAKLQAAERKKVQDSIPKLQAEVTQEERSAKLAGMKKPDRIKELKAELTENERLKKLYGEMFEHSNDFLPGSAKDPEFQKKSLEYALAAARNKKDLAELTNKPAEHVREERQFDSLAKIGGFTEQAGFGAATGSLDNIARFTQETARNTRPGQRLPRRMP